MKIREKEDFTGKYWLGRWDDYLKYVVEYVEELNPKKVIEMGTNGISLCLDSDTLDISESSKPTFLQDAGKIPWPIKDKAYDLLIATQVWEHLKGNQELAFSEVKRISKSAILSFPYLWPNGSESHKGITKEIINKWTLNEPFSKEIIIESSNRLKRLIRLFIF